MGNAGTSSKPVDQPKLHIRLFKVCIFGINASIRCIYKLWMFNVYFYVKIYFL
jgi:hypothetical protein